MPPAARDTVLIVDDSADTIAMLAEALENAGLTALVAMRGERALEIAGQVTPDLVLLDAMMPGMDGFETCRRMKQVDALSRVPVIFMTGLTETDDIVKGLEAGGVDYVTKPIEPKELLARMRVHLGNARLERGVRTALDSTGRFLLAVDNEGRLRWWTQQAGRLLAPLVDETLGAGVMLPPPVPRLVAESDADILTMNAVLRPPAGKNAASVRITCIGRLGPNELLMRIKEDAATADLESRLRERLQMSSREAQVLSWIAQGKSNRDIADILQVSPRTINKHLERIFKKLGVENRTTAAALALKHLEPD